MKLSLLVGLVITCISLLAINVISADSQEIFGSGSPISNPKEAVEVALTCLGSVCIEAEDSSSMVSNCEVLTFVDSTTPFIGEVFNGRRVWQVPIFNAILLPGRAKEEFERSYPKDIYVSVDSATGKLIEIRVLHHGTDKSFAEVKPSRSSAEGQIKARGQKYKRLPDQLPTRSFIQALENVMHSPYMANEIVGIFVIYESDFTPADPLWIISIYGAPPWIPSGRAKNVPVNQLNHSRTFVRDDNGHSWADNTPNPIDWPPPPQDKRAKPDSSHDEYFAPLKGIPIVPGDDKQQRHLEPKRDSADSVNR